MTLHSLSKFFHILLGMVALYFLAAAPAYAQVVINEVHPAPSSGADWVELYNTGNTAADLTGWKLEDQLTSPSTIASWTTATSLAADAYLVVEVSNKLNNAADGVTLKNSAGQIIDQMNYSSSTTDQSWAKIPNGSGSFGLSSATRGTANPVPSPSPSPIPSLSPSPTPTATPQSNPSPSPTPASSPTPAASPTPLASSYPATLTLSEIMACPETGQEEWVEIYNPDNSTYTLANWQLRDSSNNLKTVNTTLAAHGYTVIPFTSAWLNNDGDSLTLIRPDSVTLFTEQFGACTKGSSLIKVDDTWQNTIQITKGAANPQPDPISSPTIEDLQGISTVITPLLTASKSAINIQTPLIPPPSTELSNNLGLESAPSASFGAVLLTTSPLPSPSPKSAPAVTKQRTSLPSISLITLLLGIGCWLVTTLLIGWIIFDFKKAGISLSQLFSTEPELIDPMKQLDTNNPFM